MVPATISGLLLPYGQANRSLFRLKINLHLRLRLTAKNNVVLSYFQIYKTAAVVPNLVLVLYII